MPRLLIGTSGWVYRHWTGVFYPAGLRPEQQLAFYTTRFPTVEINYSYYHLPERSVFERWRAQTPPGFVFAVKGSRYLTHLKKLKDPDEPLARLMRGAAGLGDKLGPVLFQFPRWWSANLERLEAFLGALQAHPGQRCAFEFRHRGWLTPAVFDLLERHDAALCLPVGWGIPLEIRRTASWTYIRFHGGQHGTGFTDRELAAWAERLRRDFLGQGIDSYAYFNNDPDGHAVRDAERLRRLLQG